MESFNKIMRCYYDPWKAKKLGREVAPFDDALWKRCRVRIMQYGLYLKFQQNERLCNVLRATTGFTLVEAAPNDTVWGIGRSVTQAKAGDLWVGTNLLGRR